MIWPPRAFCELDQVAPLESAPALSTITRLPASSMGRQMRSAPGRCAFDREVGVLKNSSGSTSGQTMRPHQGRQYALLWSQRPRRRA
jgi:hypothetical protein